MNTLKEKRDKAMMLGGEAAIGKRHAKGLLTARERIELLVDKGSFHELDMFVQSLSNDASDETPGDGVITGTAKICGHTVCIFSQDFTVLGGSLGISHAHKITKVQDLALKLRCPIIGINDSGGARIQDGVDALAGYGEIFFKNTQLSGVVPQISVILGPCAGGAAYSPALTDFVFMVDGISKMFLTGPAVIETVMGETISQEDLGGAKVHAEKAGTAHFFANSEKEALEQVRDLIDMLKGEPKPANSKRKHKSIQGIIPQDGKMPYDVREVITELVDNDIIEVHKLFAQNIVCAFGHIDGKIVGIVANQPYYLAGALDADAADKCSRFVRYCDSFNIPIITLMDVPGCLPGVDGELRGAVRHGAKIFYAYAEATVPMVTLILRKAYGGGYVCLGSKHIGADLVYALPSAEIAVMGPESAASVIYRKEIAASEDAEKTKAEKTAEYRKEYANPYIAAAKGYIDDVIAPDEARERIANALDMLKVKHSQPISKKHGIMPV